jgi:hypothetical protein
LGYFSSDFASLELVRRDGFLGAGEGVVEDQADLDDQRAALGGFVEQVQELEGRIQQPGEES